RADSDVDISVLADKPLDAGRKQELIKLLAKASGCPVDLVDLRTAGVLLRRSALLNGKRLVCRDNQIYADLLSRTLTDVEDFLPYRERLLKQRTNAWTS
ncbi:MAG: nucleotidyltransferase domain-containing protein, partial [Gammaproteobacteria bacterium]|nr:nucleotidyltransferase domain-containing protein [Gammaproteobacteria bacterium]